MSSSTAGAAGSSASPGNQVRGSGVAFADQCILIPVGFASATPPYSTAEYDTSATAGPSRTRGSEDLQHTLPQLSHESTPASDAVSAGGPNSPHHGTGNTLQQTAELPLSSSDVTSSCLVPSSTANTVSVVPTPKSILKQPRRARASSMSKDRSSSSLPGASRGSTSAAVPVVSSASPSTPAKVAPLPFKATLQAPTPQKGVAAPRPAYRPLLLGSASDDEDDPPSPRKEAAPGVSAPSPLPLASVSSTSGKRYPHDGQGPPIVHAEGLLEAAGRRYRSTFEQTTRSAPPSPSLSILELSAKPSPTLSDTSDTRNKSEQYAEGSRASVPSTGASVGTEASTARTSGTTLTRSVSESSHLVGAAPGGRRPHWLRMTRHSPLSHPEDTTTDDHVSDSETDPSSPSVSEPELVPLNTECVCQHCSGRITAGLSATYIAHWSKGARAKWLADRKQAAQSEGGGDRVLAQALSLSRGDAALVLPDSSRRSTRSPPPLSSKRPFDPTRGSAPIGSHQSFRGVVTYHSVLQDPTRPPAVNIALRPPSAVEQGDEDATADLQQILDRNNRSISSLADKVQVDEVDKKHGRASQPNAIAGLTSPELEVAQEEFFPPVDSFPVFRRSPVGVSEEETIDADAALAHQVELEVRAREEKQRNEKVRRRGGARGMLAMLEEAGTQEDIAKERRLLRRSSTGESRSPLTSGHDEPHGKAFLPPSPALPSPGSRSNSPFFDRLRDGFRSSSRSSNRSSHSEDSRQAAAEAQSSLVQLPIAPSGKVQTAEEDRLRRPRHSTGGLKERSTARGSDGLLTPAINQSYLSPRFNGREPSRNSPPSQSLRPDSSRPVKSSRLGLSPSPTSALPLPLASKVSSTPGSVDDGRIADPVRAKRPSVEDRRIIESDRAAMAAMKIAPASVSMSPTKSQQSRDKEKVYFGTTWNPSLSSSAASLPPGSTPPEAKPSTGQTQKGAATSASQLNPVGASTSAAPAPATTSAQARDVAVAKRASVIRENVGAPSVPAAPAAPSMSVRRSASQGQPPSTQRETGKKAPSSQSRPTEAAATSADQTAERLKKRSLRRRLSAPIKGFFESKS